MIYVKNNQFVHNETPLLLLSGEIHYFRLDPSTWQEMLQKLVDTGCNTVATYIPWLYHQEIESECDFTGYTSPRKNLVYFLELCQSMNLFVILRPGPYVMAEIKKEGIPYWMFEKHPESISVTWNNTKVSTPLFDVLDSNFLEEVQTWYKKLHVAIAPFLQQNNGPVIGIQLDNEVGMLSWVTNAPELNEDITSKLDALYPNLTNHIPSNLDALSYRETLISLMRDRFKTYIDTLKYFWVSMDVTDMIYFINIHGTSHGRAKTFPIGIQQLLHTYQDNDILAGSDIYIDDITLETAHDYYITNEFLLSTSPDKPVTTLEFNTSDGNFGDNLHKRNNPSSIDFKVRLSIMQNQKLINYYLLTGGTNDRMNHYKEIDGNDRVAITGERHGFAAPIQPDGSTLYTYPRLQYVTQMMRNISPYFLDMSHTTDSLFVGFNPDDFATEYTLQESENWKDINQHLEFHRQAILWDTVLKQSLLLQHRFSALRLDNGESINPSLVPHLIVNTSKYVSSTIQSKLVTYHKNGGALFLVGEYPELDTDGTSCTTLIDYLQITPGKMLYDWEVINLSLVSETPIKGTHEFRSFYAQTCTTPHTPLFTEYQSGETVGVLGDKFVYVTSAYPGDLSFTKYLYNYLSFTPHLEIKSKDGMILSSIQSNKDSSFIHLMNLDHYDHEIEVFLEGRPLFDHPIQLFSQDAYMIPLHIRTAHYEIVLSTAELFKVTDTSLTVRLTQDKDVLYIKTNKTIIDSNEYTVQVEDDLYEVTSTVHGKVQTFITIYFN